MKFNANDSLLRGFRIKIYPTKDQEEKLITTFNLYRKAYNMAINIQESDRSRYIGYYEMCKIFSDIVKTEEYSWLNQIPISTIRQALVDHDTAYKRFFKKLTNHPKFHSKRKSKKYFSTRSERTHAYGNNIFIPGIGLIDAKNHPIPNKIRLYHTSVHFDGYNYWFSCQVEREPVDISDVPISDPIGVDVGFRNLITTSNGKIYNFPNSINKLKKKKKRQQRRLDKDFRKYVNISKRTTTKYEDVPKSKNHYKRLAKLRKTYDKIRNIRKNTIHNATKDIVNNHPSTIVLEDLKVRELTRQAWLKKYADYPLYEIRRQLEYKAQERGINVIIADTHYPSSKLCSNCGYLYKTFDSQHTFICPVCGNRLDRDLNAAYNLRNLAYQNMQ